MRQFVFADDERLAELRRMLDDGQCHVFHNRWLPRGCTPRVARLGFERNAEGHYILYIDKGIFCTLSDPDLRALLDTGELHFYSMEDMASYLRSLRPLFARDDGVEPGETVVGYARNPNQRHWPDNTGDPFRLDGDTLPLDFPDGTAPVRLPPEIYDPSRRPRSDVKPRELYDAGRVRALREESGRQRQVWPEDIARPLKQRVFGQNDAIDEIAARIVINRMRRESRLLVLALLGPTATGKSETARSLAEALTQVYGEPHGFIEIAGGEFVNEHDLHRFFGAPPGCAGNDKETLLEPVRRNPRHVIVINEIEKADQRLLTGLMEAVDTGMLGMADNSAPIDLNRCVLCLTSNLPIDMEIYATLSPFERSELCRDAFTRHCGRPEISGKIGNFIVFGALDDIANADIIARFVGEELLNHDLVLSRIDDYLMVDFLKYADLAHCGARSIRDMVSEALGRQLPGERRLEGLRGRAVTLKGSIDNIEFEIV